jgi:hypothetical protein
MDAVNNFDILVDDAIEQLSSDHINEGVDCLVALAHVFAKAGCDMQSFLDMRKFIIQQATEKTDAYFIQTKVELAEKQLMEFRDGKRSIIVH